MILITVPAIRCSPRRSPGAPKAGFPIRVNKRLPAALRKAKCRSKWLLPCAVAGALGHGDISPMTTTAAPVAPKRAPWAPSPTGAVSAFVRHHFRHFNAASLVDAAEAYSAHLDGGGKMFVTLAGAMSTAEIGRAHV